MAQVTNILSINNLTNYAVSVDNGETAEEFVIQSKQNLIKSIWIPWIGS